jgi:acetyltransferase-like isoleucine patch superfamily enzyme
MAMDNELVKDTLVDSLSSKTESSIQKYQDIYVGGNSILDLMQYELTISLLAPIPGALGFFLRRYFSKHRFATVGRGVMIGSNVTLRCPNRIWLGDNIAIDSSAVLDAKGRESLIHIGNSVLIGKGSIFSCASGKINVGNEVSTGPYCYIRASRSSIVMGSDITIGSHTVIISGSPDYERLDIPMMKQLGSARGIIIEDDVWIGVGVQVIDGVKIGRGSVIGAGAVVISDIPPYGIATGVPAKVIKMRDGSRVEG